MGAVSEESARGIIEWHGKRAADIARMALVSAELRAPICPHTSHVIAEVVEAYRREFAMTLADVLLRRVPVALGPAGQSYAAVKRRCGSALSLAGMSTPWGRILKPLRWSARLFSGLHHARKLCSKPPRIKFG